MQNKAALTTEVKFRRLHRTQRCYGPGSVRSSGVQTKAQATSLTSVVQSNTKDRSEVVDKQHYVGKKALVVGAGPAGSVAASFLAKQGFHVDIYEKRSDPEQENTTQSRSLPITLTQNTVTVLRAIDVSLPDMSDGFINGLHPHYGVAVLTKDKPNLPISMRNLTRIRAERDNLAKHIISTVKNQYPEKVAFHFDKTCVGVDFNKQEVQFQNQDNNVVVENYDLLIGADGANSEIRTAMESDIDSFIVSSIRSNIFYKSFQLYVINEDTVQGKYKEMLNPRYSYVLRNASNAEVKDELHTISFHRMSDGKFIGNFYGTEYFFQSVIGKEKEYLKEHLPRDFPPEWMDQMVEQFVESKLYRVPSIIRVSSLVGPNAALIGDAAHAVGPVIGYGCNMAIQDSDVLYNALETAEGNLEEALKKYNDVRFDEVRQVQLMAQMSKFDSLEHKGIYKMLPFLHDMHSNFHKYGRDYFPWIVPVSPLGKFYTEEITPKKAVQILKIELVCLLIILLASSVSLSQFFKAVLEQL